jgi:hypothetical protein
MGFGRRTVLDCAIATVRREVAMPQRTAVWRELSKARFPPRYVDMGTVVSSASSFWQVMLASAESRGMAFAPFNAHEENRGLTVHRVDILRLR